MLSMLAAWGDYWVRQGVKINCKNTDAKGVDYVARMGLFKYISATNPREITEHEPSGSFVPITKLVNSSDRAKFMANLMPILNKNHSRYSDAVKYSLSELTNNVMEHAGGAPAFACAQYYKQSDKVSIGVADCGIGLYTSLSNTISVVDDCDSVMQSVKPGISGAVKSVYSSSDNAGAGLFYNKCIAHASRQYFAIISGSAAFRLRRKQNSIDFNASPVNDRHDVYQNLPNWKGTVVGLDIKVASGREFNNLSKRVLETYTRQYRPKKKVNINFE